MRALIFVCALAGLGAFAFTGGVSRVGALLQLVGPPIAASSATLGEHELEEINAMSPDDQAKRLIERTINHYKGAAEESRNASRAGRAGSKRPRSSTD